jgi:hypothetical protein
LRPTKLYPHQAQDLLITYQNATKFYKAQKNCNQYYIAKKIKEDFAKCDYLSETPPNIKDHEIKRLAEKYDIPESSVTNLACYVCRVSPAAIVQMCKRIRNQVQN